MAMSVQPYLVGVDVSKAELVICQHPDSPLVVLDNEPGAISDWLRGLGAAPLCVAVEATNTFHLELVEQAHRRGHTVYVVDGFRLNRYRQSIGGRAKTDAGDARLLRRYLDRERADLRPWSPPSKGYRSLQQLLRSSDAFIAFLGLDVRVRDSGTCRGRRKLTKQGDPELRRLLHLAAMQACRHPSWQGFYQRYTDRGLSKIQALVILARKLARVAFALLKNQSIYQPRDRMAACAGT